jgi:UDP-N-acetyl-D-mannosaminuronic acid dehydrogenase
MENTTRDVNIALANEFARLAEKFSVDVWEAIRLANLHPRINILSPGPGVGGHCISVDPWFLVETAPELATLIYQARQVNDGQPRFVVEKMRQVLSTLEGKRIAALGAAYKADVDDLRESPATEVVHLLQEAGAQVKVWEPFKPDAVIQGMDMAPSLDTAIQEADAILLLVKHTEFVQLDPFAIAAKTRARIVVDCVNGFPAQRWESAGFSLQRLGVNRSDLVNQKS